MQINPRISVVLCTRNRQGQLARCIDKLNTAEFEAANAELVLVDSASTDSTLQLLESFAAGNSQLRVKVVSLDKKGLGLARNAGVAASDGALLMFLDDDVYLKPGYLSTLLDVASEQPELIGIFGGMIENFDSEDSQYGCKVGTKSKRYDPGAVVIPGAFQGTNLAARRIAFDAAGGFDEDLGPGKRYRCDDIDFVARVFKSGFGGVYEPRLQVFHHHGRKDGEDISDLRVSNSLAGGAYFAKMLKLGYWGYFPLFLAYILASPFRPNLKLTHLARGFLEYSRNEHSSQG